MTVHEWLNSERDYEAGRQLYAALGDNDRLKRLLSSGPSLYNREAVAWELTKLARAGAGQLSVSRHKLPPSGEPGLDEFGNRMAPAHYFLPLAEAEKLQNATETLQNVPTSPEKGAELLAELRDARRPLYDERGGLHAQLEVVRDEEDRRLLAVRIMALTREIDTNWNTTHYVEAHGDLPPPAAAPGLDTLPPTDLLKRRNNLRSQVSKLKNRPDRAHDLAAAQTHLAAVEALLSHE